MRHVQVMARDEDRIRVLAKGVLKRLHQLVVSVAIGGINMPCNGIHQSVIRLIHRQIHPVRLCDMNTDRHLQLACFLNQRLHTRVVDMNILAVRRTSVGVTFAFVA